MQVNLSLRKDQEYIWRVAKAHARDEGITLSQLVAKALLLYCTRNGTMLRE